MPKARSSLQSGWKFMPIKNSVFFHKSSVKSQILLFTKGSYFCQGRQNWRRFENAVGLDLLNFPIYSCSFVCWPFQPTFLSRFNVALVVFNLLALRQTTQYSPSGFAFGSQRNLPCRESVSIGPRNVLLQDRSYFGDERLDIRKCKVQWHVHIHLKASGAVEPIARPEREPSFAANRCYSTNCGMLRVLWNGLSPVFEICHH